jgi:2-desacetyl-2-hydroxyethyl bacteriochlorophyllide A dehydrogenase
MNSMKMRAAVLAGPRQLIVTEIVPPEPKSDEVCVQLEGCGVCASNLSLWEGKPWFSYPMEPGAPGHEGWGVVHSIGTHVAEFQPGDRVGLLSLHGFAEFDIANQNAIVKLPDALDGRPFPAEPLGCGINVFRRARIEKGDTVAIVGVGFLGAVVLRLAALAGAKVIAITRRRKGLQIAKHYGAVECLPMEDHSQVINRVKELTGGRFCEVVVEATGKQWPVDLSAELTAVRGRLVVAGYHQDGPRQVNMQLWNWRGLDVINAHERDAEIYRLGMQAAVDLVATGGLDPTPLYTHFYPLDKIEEAFEATANRPDDFMKALVMFSG